MSGEILAGTLPSPEISYPFMPNSGKSALLRSNGAVFAYTRRDLVLLSERKRITPSASTGTASMPFLALPDEHGVRLHATSQGLPTAEIVARIALPDQETKSSLTALDPFVRTLWGDGRLYVLSASMISIFDVDKSGMATLSVEMSLSAPPVAMAWLSSGFLVVALHREGLQIIDVRTAPTPRVVGTYPLAKHQQSVGTFKDLLVDGNRLYAARAKLGVEIYDLSNPADPQLIQRLDTPGYASKLMLEEGLLLVNDTDHGVFVIDTTGEQALPVGSYHLPTHAGEIACDGTSLFVLNTSGGILRLPPPLRLAANVAVANNQARLRIPAGVAHGSYMLALYDDQTVVNLPVTLP